MSKKSPIALVSDSCVDLPLSYTQYPFARIVPLNITFSDGTVIQDGVDISAAEFYRRMARADALPVTSQPSPEQFLTVYQELLNDYERIISLHISSELSGTFNSATLAVQMLAEDEKKRVDLVDTKMVSLLEGFAFLAVAKAIEAGQSRDEIMSIIDRQLKSLTCFFLPDTLDNLRKGGRISHIGALIGGFLQVKPVLSIGFKTDGKVGSYAKVRGKKKAVKLILDAIKANADNLSAQTIGLVHSFIDNESELHALQELVQSELQPKKIITSIVGATVGTHLGQNGFGIVYYE